MEATIFEAAMLICFGCAWPFSIYKTYTTKSSEGKSLFFLIVILYGYVFGVFFEVTGRQDAVTYLYAVNAILISIDTFLTVKYRKNSVKISKEVRKHKLYTPF